MQDEKKTVGLPENAFRPLNQGEDYKPLLPANEPFKGVNTWSVTWGVIMAIIFSAAAAYLGLKVVQVFEAAIPIAIISVGLSSGATRNNSIAGNVLLSSYGTC